MSASASSNPLPTHAGAERLAGFWTGILAVAEMARLA